MLDETLNLRPLSQLATAKASPVRLALGAGIAVLALLFVIWPYQSWQFGSRQSVLLGWYKVVQLGKAEWMFCLVVPFIAGGVVYMERDRFARLPLEGSWTGLWWMALGAIFYWLGYKVDTGYLGYAAIQSTLAGLIILLAGPAWMRALYFGWMFLFFAWPLFPLDDLVAGKLKVPTAEMAAVILRTLGVDTVRVGSVLESGANPLAALTQGAIFRLEVSDACSGMRSLYALVMVSVLYAHLSLRRTGPKFILFASAVPLAIVGNVVRLLLLAFGSIWFGQNFAIGVNLPDGRLEESTYHLLCGIAVFCVALAGMFGLATVLEGGHWNRIRQTMSALKKSPRDAAASGGGGEAVLPHALAALGMAALAILMCLTTPKKPNFAEPGMKLELPEVIGDYTSAHQDMTLKERDVFDPGVRLDRRVYTDSRGHSILGTLVLAGEAKKSLHTPEVCLPNAGWVKVDTHEMPIILDDGGEVTVTLLRLFRDAVDDSGRRFRVTALDVNWYIGSEGVSTPSYFMSNFLTYRDAIFQNLNHRWGQASFILQMRQQGDVKTDGLAEVGALEDLQAFIAKAAPKFLRSTGGIQ